MNFIACESFWTFELPAGSTRGPKTDGSDVDFIANETPEAWIEVKSFRSLLPEHQEQVDRQYSEGSWADKLPKKFDDTYNWISDQRQVSHETRPICLVESSHIQELKIIVFNDVKKLILSNTYGKLPTELAPLEIELIENIQRILPSSNAWKCPANSSGCNRPLDGCSFLRQKHKES